MSKTAERKDLAALLFRMIDQQRSQEEIEAAAVAAGERLGLSRSEVCRVALAVAARACERAA